MTDQITVARSTLNEIESQIAVLQREEREGIDAVRMLNQKVRFAQAEIRAKSEQANTLRKQIHAAEIAERERLAAEAAEEAAREAAEKEAAGTASNDDQPEPSQGDPTPTPET